MPRHMSDLSKSSYVMNICDKKRSGMWHDLEVNLLIDRGAMQGEWEMGDIFVHFHS